MVPHECGSESEEQKGFVVSEQTHQTTFPVLIFFLEISAWPGGFFLTWKGLKAAEVVGCILPALLTHPLGCCRQILECGSVCPNLPEAKDSLQERSSATQSSPKVWREKEKSTPTSSRRKVDFVLMATSKALQASW